MRSSRRRSRLRSSRFPYGHFLPLYSRGFASPRVRAAFGDSVHAKVSLTEGSIPRTLLAFSLPILFGNVLQSVNGSVNAIWVGKYLGSAAFAAAGIANVVMFLLFGVMFGFSMA